MFEAPKSGRVEMEKLWERFIDKYLAMKNNEEQVDFESGIIVLGM